MRKIIILFSIALAFISCVSRKKYRELEMKQETTQNLLNTCTATLNSCLEEKEILNASTANLKETNQNLLTNLSNMTVLSAKGAENIEKALEAIKEKELKINRLQDAINKKDSLAFAVVSSLKSAVGMDDTDIEINVEKGVVFISISDKLLFKTGSYEVNSKARNILTKVAKVVKSKPDFECMVEGHTDNVPYTGGVLVDNWDLSVKRSTSIIRVLTNELGVKPSQLIAAGRSSYIPLFPNNSPENRSKNRRTRIVILPKIDQFYDMVEREMKQKK